MVGDEAACRAAFAVLQERMSQLHLARLEISTPAAETATAWQALVPRFRALRESLTSEGVTGTFVLDAYEAAAEVCLRAGDMGEYLKCQARQACVFQLTRASVADTPYHSHSNAWWRSCTRLHLLQAAVPPDTRSSWHWRCSISHALEEALPTKWLLH
jgi:hypothetical protein